MIDPQRFRTTHYGARRYWDREPACEIAEPSDTKLLNVTAINKAVESGGFYKRSPAGARVPLDALRVADYALAEWERLAAQRADVRHELLAGAAGRDLKRAGERGTAVHALIEGLTNGQSPLLLSDEAAAYTEVAKEVAHAFTDRITQTEVVMFSRDGSRPGFDGEGFTEYGGTADVLGRSTDGEGVMLADYKTRGPDSAHGCYPSEVAQLGLLSLAGYYFTANEAGEPVRVRLTNVTELLVVSIRPDGFEVFPVALDAAREVAMAALEIDGARRHAQSRARAGVGEPQMPAPRPVNPRKEDAETLEETVSGVSGFDDAPLLGWFQQRYNALVAAGHRDVVIGRWPAGMPGPKRAGEWNGEQLGEALKVLDRVEAAVEMPFPSPDPSVPPRPPRHKKVRTPKPAPVPLRARTDDDSLQADPDDVAQVRAVFEDLNQAQRDQLLAWRGEAKAAGVDWHLGKTPSQRRLEITEAAIALLEHADTDAEAIVALVIGVEEAAGHPLGALLGTLSRAEARHVGEFAVLGLDAAVDVVAEAAPSAVTG